MTNLNEVYKCNICGNMVEVIHTGQGTLVCCGENMVLLTAKTKDIGNEKHLPVVERTGDAVTVKVGSVSHPMEEKHYIEWIEIITDGQVCRKFLKPGEVPAATFSVKAENIVAREYCNIHGFWQTE